MSGTAPSLATSDHQECVGCVKGHTWNRGTGHLYFPHPQEAQPWELTPEESAGLMITATAQRKLLRTNAESGRMRRVVRSGGERAGRN